MKRALDEVPGCSNWKRHHSSLVSISTTVEEEEETESLPQCMDTTLSVTLTKEYVAEATASSSATTTASSGTVASWDNGFFLEEDEEGEEERNQGTTKIPATSLPASQQSLRTDLRTGLVFEAGSAHFDRSNRLHKERPARVLSVMEALEKDNLLEQCQNISDTEPDAISFLEDQDYLRVHLPGYMQRLNNLANCSCTQLDCEASQYQSIFLNDQSTREAKRAATALCTLVSRVVQGQLDNGFAVIRPPGHHAEPGLAGGYCLINNIAVAAAFAQARLGVQRILIVDWDIHHGNGTQSIFLNNPHVLYFSVHRWHGGNYFPFLNNGGPTTIGVGPGMGCNVNVGWNRKGMGDEEYFAVWERLLMPIAREFQPDLVLVSSGFDGAAGDMGECEVSPECFQLLTGALMSLGPVVCALEGGYARSVLQACVKSVVRALLDPNSPEKYQQCEQEALQERQGVDILETIDSSAAKAILATLKAHAPYWACLRNDPKE